MYSAAVFYKEIHKAILSAKSLYVDVTLQCILTSVTLLLSELKNFYDRNTSSLCGACYGCFFDVFRKPSQGLLVMISLMTAMRIGAGF